MVVHIVEHYPKGTIYNLIKPLVDYGQLMVYTPEDIEDITDFFAFPEDTVFILHVTGRALPVFNNFERIVDQYKAAIFLHVSIAYMEFQKRFTAIERIVYLNRMGVDLLVPCNNIQKQLLLRNIKSYVIQLGIPEINIYKNEYAHLLPYCGKVVTCCSEDTLPYLYAKGIDCFLKFIKDNDMFSDALIVGAPLPDMSIQSKRFTHDEFLFILQNSKAYVQFSRFEAYNLTAVEAKRLKVPVILLECEGVSDNVKYGYVCKDFAEMDTTIKKLISCHSNNLVNEVIEQNYIDSVRRESLLSFVESIQRWWKNVCT